MLAEARAEEEKERVSGEAKSETAERKGRQTQNAPTHKDDTVGLSNYMQRTITYKTRTPISSLKAFRLGALLFQSR